MTHTVAAHTLPRRRRAQGFTLIELMVTVAVIAILARIALPSYLDYVKRGKVTEAFNQLTATSLALGQYYQDNRTYAGTTAFTCPSSTTNFSYSCGTPTATTYTITATALTGSAVYGAIYTLNQDGIKGTLGVPSGWPTNSGNCWVSSRSGSCS